MSYKNITLHNALLAFTKKFFQLAEKHLNNNDLELCTETFLEQEEDWVYEATEVKLPAWSALENIIDLDNLSEYARCSRAIKRSKIINNQIGKYIGNEYGSGLVELKKLLLYIPYTLLDKKLKPDFKLDEFESVYLNFERKLDSDKIRNTRITPVFGFDAKSSNIKLEKNIEIKLLDEKTVSFLYKCGIVLGEQVGKGIMHTPKYGIFISYESPKKICTHWGGLMTTTEPIPVRTGELENRVLQSLRLMKEGYIYPSGTADITDQYPGAFGYSVGLNKVILPDRHWIGDKRYYPLTKKEETKLKDNWKILRKFGSDKYRNMDIALRRFSMACERSSVEDKIIDLLICAEALFLKGFEGELSYRLSLRTAFFLAKNTSERKVIYQFMRDLYNKRSKIVHGGEPSKRNQSYAEKIQDLKQASNKAEYYIRAAINKYIKLGLNKRESKEYFDSLILNK